MITALIVDDEQHNVNVLHALLKTYCPEINVVSMANSADMAFEEINKHNPQLVFLDIKMPHKSGFDLLRMFPEIDFEVIFVSAYNEYAIKAFDFHALGYILKPIDFTNLQKSVKRAEKLINNKYRNDGDISNFMKSLADKGDFIDKISVHHNDKVIFVNVDEIVFIEAQSDYCDLNLKNGGYYTSSKDLKKFEELLSKNGNFIRINKSIIINIDFIKSYSKGEICEITVSTNQIFEVSRRKKTEILALLKTK